MKLFYRLMLFCVFITLPSTWVYAEDAANGKPPAAAIASAHFLATEAGFEILAKGGNAFDAAIAVSSTLSVVEPISSGIGGGGFFLLHDAESGKDIFLDARETSPKSAHQGKYKTADGKFDSDRATNGPWAAGIPGLPAALVYLAEHHGKLPLKTSLAPAIKAARDGFTVYARMEEGYESRREVMERYKGTREVFLKNGEPIKTGDLFKQPDLANTLEKLANLGYDGFYKGDIASKLVDGVNSEGGEWTLDELASYKVVVREPLRFNYRDWQIVTAPPPSSGGIALAQILQILEPYDLAKMNEADRVHLTVEAMRRAYRDRTFYLGDPDFVKIPVKLLTAPDYAAGLRAGINPDKATPSTMLSGKPTPMEDEETTHFSILDKQGNMVAATQTVNLLYGSGLIPSGTGVLLNNEMDDFALMPGVPNAFGVMGYDANAPQPGKRMLSSMSPTFMISKDKTAILGTPGGSRIITMVLFGILGYDQGLSAQQVAAFPRYHHQWWPDNIDMENEAISAAAVPKLKDLGHDFVIPKKNDDGTTSSHIWGNLQTILWDHAGKKVDAASDPRHDVGKALVE
ncbi:gamma-glutamyltransferase [Bartonella sp. HY329]|uniref:gamma-glutamyltransferase n=1 Tax=unclassified Bartonella TaxID=2645622 RepID=UPI0021C78D2C|nr:MULTISPECIES: gamma-glutamyltransferase [unclassified Bartonella]UXM95888.1 gamma-glutamyltransferase [Bartonella sp. HY329]UXN10213.1 gamma-glutamyltransferase [Bartonella sp. HY328]